MIGKQILLYDNDFLWNVKVLYNGGVKVQLCNIYKKCKESGYLKHREHWHLKSEQVTNKARSELEQGA